jgi:hypothetical protein
LPNSWNPFKKDGDKKDDQSKSEVDELVEKLGASFEAKLSERLDPLQKGFTELKGEWDGIKAAANKTDDPPPADDTLTEEQKLKKNQDGLFALNVATNARLTESEVISEISANWAHLIPEIRTILAATPLQRKAQADYAVYCRNVKDMIVGQAAQKAGLRYDSKGSRFFLEDAAASSVNSESTFNDPELNWVNPKTGRVSTFSEQLGKLGIDPKEFAENQKKGYV